MDSTTYGYARTSEPDQDFTARLTALKEQGLEDDCIFGDDYSHKRNTHPQFNKLLRKLRKGDVLLVPSVDCLGLTSSENRLPCAHPLASLAPARTANIASPRPTISPLMYVRGFPRRPLYASVATR